MISAISLTGIILIVIGVLLFIVAAYLVACYIGYYLIIVKPPRFDVTKPNALIGPDFPAMVRQLHIDIKELKNYHSEPITVVTADGLKLYGYFYRNPKETKVTIVCLHGYNSTGYGDFGSRALGYLKLGYNVLIVNHRHSAKSEGKCTGFGRRNFHFGAIHGRRACHAGFLYGLTEKRQSHYRGLRIYFGKRSFRISMQASSSFRTAPDD